MQRNAQLTFNFQLLCIVGSKQKENLIRYEREFTNYNHYADF